MINYIIGKYEIEKFNKLKEESPDKLKELLYNVAKNCFNLNEILAKAIPYCETAKEVATCFNIPYDKDSIGTIQSELSETYIDIENKFRMTCSLAETKFIMDALHCYDIIETKISHNFFRINVCKKTVDLRRLYSICKYSNNMTLYKSYFHDKYCKDITEVAGKTLWSAISFKRNVTVKDALNIPSLASKMITSDKETYFGAKIYEINPIYGKYVNLVDISTYFPYKSSLI